MNHIYWNPSLYTHCILSFSLGNIYCKSLRSYGCEFQMFHRRNCFDEHQIYIPLFACYVKTANYNNPSSSCSCPTPREPCLFPCCRWLFRFSFAIYVFIFSLHRPLSLDTCFHLFTSYFLFPRPVWSTQPPQLGRVCNACLCLPTVRLLTLRRCLQRRWQNIKQKHFHFENSFFL